MIHMLHMLSICFAVLAALIAVVVLARACFLLNSFNLKSTRWKSGEPEGGDIDD